MLCTTTMMHTQSRITPCSAPASTFPPASPSVIHTNSPEPPGFTFPVFLFQEQNVRGLSGEVHTPLRLSGVSSIRALTHGRCFLLMHIGQCFDSGTTRSTQPDVSLALQLRSSRTYWGT